jgi:hypothetical protein
MDGSFETHRAYVKANDFVVAHLKFSLSCTTLKPELPGSTKSKLNEYYNLSALTVPAPYTYGNFLRNTVYGPGVLNFAASLGKTFDVWPDRGVKMQIRADAGNVLNHPSFGQPGNNAIGNGESANITSTTVGGRQIQLYGRISF